MKDVVLLGLIYFFTISVMFVSTLKSNFWALFCLIVSFLFVVIIWQETTKENKRR